MGLSPRLIRRMLITAGVFVTAIALLIVPLVILAEQATTARTAGAGDSVASASENASATVEESQAATTAVFSAIGAPLAPYQGLGSWVDVWDTSAWRRPSAAVDDMANRGVRTLFVQTSNYSAPGPFFNKKALREFITAGHAHGMQVVAWYLPNMKPGSVDYARVAAAVNFRTADGQTFDSLALDIECQDIHSEAMRNRGLKALSQRIRALVGPTYPLGAIIPAPVGLRKDTSAWHNFPYTMLASVYDVFVPMGYYTVHGGGARTAYDDSRSNVKILRSQPGCAQAQVHLIGGIAEDSSAPQVKAFVQATREGKCIGASLYGWAGTSSRAWRALWAIKPSAGPTPTPAMVSRTAQAAYRLRDR